MNIHTHKKNDMLILKKSLNCLTLYLRPINVKQFKNPAAFLKLHYKIQNSYRS